jgi:hypothetical protein
MSLGQLPLELLTVIIDHIPLVNLPQTLYSLSLTSRSLYNLIVPVHLYRYVRLAGDSLIMSAFERFDFDLETSQMEGRLVASHCVHHISLIFARTSNQISCLLLAFKTLAQDNLFPNLRSLSVRISSGNLDDWEGLWMRWPLTNFEDDFWKCVKAMCPKLHAIDTSGFRLEPINSSISGLEVSFDMRPRSADSNARLAVEKPVRGCRPR